MAAADFVVMTAADRAFFPVLRGFERNIEKNLGVTPVIFDLGLLPEQRDALKSIRQFEHNGGDIRALSAKGFIRASHKPDFIAHLLDQGQSVLYLDADTIVTGAFDTGVFDDVDICITGRHPRDLRYAGNIDNGKLNSGVLYFRNSPATRKIVALWSDAARDPEKSDQQALSEIIERLFTHPKNPAENDDPIIKVLNPRLYNDTSLRTGYIFHVKNYIRRPSQARKFRRIAFLARYAPWILRGYTAWQRRRLGRLAPELSRDEFLSQTGPARQR